MPFQPDSPFPKQRGYSIRSKDWNDLVVEMQRLDSDKVSKIGDTMAGPLTIADSPRSLHPMDKVHLEGRLGIYPPEIEHAQTALSFSSSDRTQEFYLNRYSLGYGYGDLAADYNIFPRTVLGALGQHLFIGTRTEHQVILSTKDRPRLVVGAEGNVGVGTTAPTNKLHMFHTGPGLTIDGDAFPGFRMAFNGQQVVLAQIRTDEGNTLDFGSSGSTAISLLTNSARRLHITPSGNVGIGTTNPAAALHVTYAGDDRVGLRIQGDGNDAGLDLRVGNNYAAIQAKSADFSNPNTLVINPEGGQVVIRDGLVNGILDFGTTARQMLNLFQAQYGIGVQSNTEYFRTAAHFAWYRGGTHNNQQFEPGGGTTLMTLASSGNLEILGAVKASAFVGNGAVPRGVIVMWSGQINAVPDGWTLCNGANGAPDLRDRFIAGAGGKYGVGATGGEEFHRLTTDEMPPHNHGNGVWNLLVNNQGNGTTTQTDATSGEIDTRNAQPILSAGGNQPHENRPPYYALALIMKL